MTPARIHTEADRIAASADPHAEVCALLERVERLEAERDFYQERAFRLLDHHLHGSDRDDEYIRLDRGPGVDCG